MKKKSLVHFPPHKIILYHHLDQVNYLSYLLKHYEQNCHPSPMGRYWEYIEGKCSPVPATADVL